MTTTNANDVGLARTHRAMWIATLRHSLEHSVPMVSNDSFDDLLAQLDAIRSRPIKAAATHDERASDLFRGDAAETHLSSHVGRLATALSQFYTQLATPAPNPCR